MENLLMFKMQLTQIEHTALILLVKVGNVYKIIIKLNEKGKKSEIDGNSKFLLFFNYGEQQFQFASPRNAPGCHSNSLDFY